MDFGTGVLVWSVLAATVMYLLPIIAVCVWGHFQLKKFLPAKHRGVTQARIGLGIVLSSQLLSFIATLLPLWLESGPSTGKLLGLSKFAVVIALAAGTFFLVKALISVFCATPNNSVDR